MFRISTYFRQQIPRISLGIFALFIGLLFYMLIPIQLKKMVDEITGHAPFSALYRTAAILLGLALIQGIGRFFSRILIVSASRIMEHNIRRHIWTILLNRTPQDFSRWSAGDIMARLTQDLNAVRMMLGPALMYTSYAIISISWALYYMASIHLGLTVITLIPMSLIAVLIFLLSKKIRAYYFDVQDQYAHVTEFAHESFAGIREVKSYVLESFRTERFYEAIRALFHRQKKLIRVQSLIFPVMGFLTGSALLGLLVYGGILVSKDILTLGSFVAYQTYLFMLIWPMLSLAWIVNLIQRGQVSLKRIQDLTREHEELTETDKRLQVWMTSHRERLPDTPWNGTLLCDHVTFTYPSQNGNDSFRLHDVTFRVPVGVRMALVGPNRSGKTTLLRILTGLLAPEKGEVYWGDQPLVEWPYLFFREKVVYIPQDAWLFSMSLRENLVLGLEREVRDDDLMEILDIVGFMEDFIHLPHGLDTHIGERGVNLSGGQRQRLALARSLLRKPSVLILDDPLSQVDVEIEHEIWRKVLNWLPASTTVLLVTHRLHTVFQMDMIGILEDGELTHFGKPEEVVQQSEWFSTALALYQHLSHLPRTEVV